MKKMTIYWGSNRTQVMTGIHDSDFKDMVSDCSKDFLFNGEEHFEFKSKGSHIFINFRMAESVEVEDDPVNS